MTYPTVFSLLHASGQNLVLFHATARSWPWKPRTRRQGLEANSSVVSRHLFMRVPKLEMMAGNGFASDEFLVTDRILFDFELILK
jgi:hypothetical protein